MAPGGPGRAPSRNRVIFPRNYRRYRESGVPFRESDVFYRAVADQCPSNSQHYLESANFWRESDVFSLSPGSPPWVGAPGGRRGPPGHLSGPRRGRFAPNCRRLAPNLGSSAICQRLPTAPPSRRVYRARSHGASRSLPPKLRGGARSDGRLLGAGELLLPSVTLTMSGGRTRRGSPSVPSVLSASSLPLRAPSGRAVHRRLPSVPSVFFPPALHVLPHGGSHVSASLATRTFEDMRHRPFLCGETTSAGSDRRVSGQAARSRGRRGQA